MSKTHKDSRRVKADRADWRKAEQKRDKRLGKIGKPSRKKRLNTMKLKFRDGLYLL
jgi:hypothetical protein